MGIWHFDEEGVLWTYFKLNSVSWIWSENCTMCLWGGWGLGVVIGLPLLALTLTLAPLPLNFKTMALSLFPFPDHK